MPYTIVTSFSEKGYDEYAHRFMDSFEEFWPKDTELVVYHEGTDLSDRNCTPIDLLNEVDSCIEFIDRHKGDGIVNGTIQKVGTNWKPKCVRERYNFRFDADKFCRKVFAIEHAAHNTKNDKLLWIDADVVFTNPVSDSILQLYIPDRYTMSYLKRWGHYHSECGFIGYNLKDTRAINFIEALAKKYGEDLFFNYNEWHDSYLFDRVMEEVENNSYPIPTTNMRNVFNSSILNKCMFHMKGDLKKSTKEVKVG